MIPTMSDVFSSVVLVLVGQVWGDRRCPVLECGNLELSSFSRWVGVGITAIGGGESQMASVMHI